MTPELPPAPLYLIPSRIADTEPLEVLPLSIKKVVDSIDHYIVENEKTTREFIRRVHPGKSQPSLHFSIYNQYTDEAEIPDLLKPCKEGFPVGLISDAGAPAIGDPGELLILKAHEYKIRVIPLVGPSSVVLALMASGLNGNQFTFHGFLPAEKSVRKKKLATLEKRALKGETQIFMESPLQNDKFLEDILSTCLDETLLCIATHITSPDEEIYTQSVGEWKNQPPSLDKRPTLFLLGSSPL
ncbi:SAM-dependent methyltransferase [Phaeocystidibacter marisrubri]|uniref:SAM-dependent methyltransferase n=1 Tax=Phaeocystidibacter marisrubri TaxID=1577780 RepID=A0A6L3ZK29_9FLAO|nr:SAM-dependent methyltransferase [Phaeocystidibacter marisrubri]KAB2817775.1 SAM-dependent methyltransferase [Phaeocystidibacter marisrubri]GGH73610.1 S-adenosylmethionine-dependent methyltransferase [Phaeocystidibacter marisrubri]